MMSWAQLGRQWNGDVKAKQRLLPAVWSTTFHRLYSEGDEQADRQQSLLQESLRPERPGRAVRMAVNAFDERLVGRTPLRLVGNNVLYSRYRLDHSGTVAMRDLAHRVEGMEKPEADAVKTFAQCRDLYGRPRSRVSMDQTNLRSRPPPVREQSYDDGRTLDDKSEDPSNFLTYMDVSFDGKMTTCAFELVLPRSKDEVLSRIDPRTWDEADSVHFLETRVLELANRRDPRLLEAPGTISWRGRYLERFALPWNTLMLSYFQVELFADLSIEPSGARLDYSLAREENRQIVRDSGFVSVRTRPRFPGWSIITAEKNTAYASPLLNALNPAVLGTWIQDQIRTFWRPIEKITTQPNIGRDIDEDDDDDAA